MLPAAVVRLPLMDGARIASALWEVFVVVWANRVERTRHLLPDRFDPLDDSGAG
jgi:hypothetical protein